MVNKETQAFFSAARFPIYFVALMWIVHILKVILELRIHRFGIYPRTMEGIKGIFLSPLIHGDFHHLISNSFPMLGMGLIIFLFYKRVALVSFVLIYIITGLLVWLFAYSNAYHIGASGVVYGLISFVFWTGVFRRNIKSIVLALIVLFLYSGYIPGILPNQENISWESHMYGGIMGIFVAFLFKNVQEPDEEEKQNPWVAEETESNKYFLPRDSFTKTKMERAQEQQDLWSGDKPS